MLTLKKTDGRIFKVLPIVLVALEDMRMSYEKVTEFQSNVIIGMKQTLKAMKNGEISEVFVADDADQHITQKVISLAKELDIPYQRVDSMKELGAACGIEVGASAVAVKREGY